MQAQDSSFVNTPTVAGKTVRKLFQILFYLYLVLISILVIFITVYGLVLDYSTHHFHPEKWYPPLLASTVCGGILGLMWQWIIASHPEKALRAAFWLSPLLTCAMGILFVLIGSALSLVVGIVSLISAVIQSLYGCWVGKRFVYATEILLVSKASPPAKTKRLACSLTVIGIIYCCFLVSGIGGAKAIQNRTKLADICILVIILSLGWTMQVLKNAIQVTVSRVKYMHFSGGGDIDTGVAFCDTVKHLIGSVCIGSILVPTIGLFRGFARSTSLIGGETNECMFSCVSCSMGIASLLVTKGNRWGFVHVGVYNKGFVQASSDTWDMFIRVGLEELIDLDLTGAFCFLSGVAVGAICSLVSGIWSLILYKNYAMELSIYAFLIGYFLVRTQFQFKYFKFNLFYLYYNYKGLPGLIYLSLYRIPTSICICVIVWTSLWKQLMACP